MSIACQRVSQSKFLVKKANDTQTLRNAGKLKRPSQKGCIKADSARGCRDWGEIHKGTERQERVLMGAICTFCVGRKCLVAKVKYLLSKLPGQQGWNRT